MAEGGAADDRIAGAGAWIDEALGRAGRTRTGTIDVHRVRPWGTVLAAPTADGTVWLKAGGLRTSFEAGLYGLLAEAVPERVLRPLAIDADRGWVLLPDGGTSLYDRAEVAGCVAETEAITLAGLEAALPAFAELQLALTRRVDELLALGVADMRSQLLPRRFEEALEATAAHAHRAGAGAHGAADAARHARVAELAGEVRAWADELEASAIGASLDHNDLHSGNVLGDAGEVRFYDWGDSVLAHPFACLLVPITFVRDRVLGGVSDDDPRLAGLRDAYLEPFAAAHGATVAELVPTLKLACRAAKIARTLTWQRALDGYGQGGAPPEWAGAPLASLASLLDDSPYGGA